MRGLIQIIALLIILLLVKINSHAQLIITPQSRAQALAQTLVGSGVVISNASLTADRRATAFFNNLSGTNVGIDSGIVLTNGMARTTGAAGWGVNGNGVVMAENALANTDQRLPGDGDLAREIGVPTAETHDACVLEFDFVPLGDSIKFKYVFSSEEYTPAFVCQFNDAFAFFISGPGITGLKNIALIPNTNTPVSIFNVNDVPGSACPNNQIYFTDNSTNKFFTHDGHTVVLTALEQVHPCETYHLKLVIADVGDGLFDSGVFLEARSLSSNVVTLSNTTQVDPQNNNYLVEGCSSGSFKVKRPQEELSPLMVTLFYGGTAIGGIDYQALPQTVTIPANQIETVVNIAPIVDNLPEGIETLKIYALAGCNAVTPSDSIVIQIRDYDTLGIVPDTTIICKNATVQLTASPGYTTYQWDTDPSLSNLNIRNPIARPTTAANTYYCTATQGTCHGRDSSLVIWKDLEFISKKEINCKNDATGEINVSGGPEWTRPVQYAVDNMPYQNDSTFTNLIAGLHTVRIKDAAGCIDSIVINIAQLYPDLTIVNAPVTPASCSGAADGTAIISVAGGSSPYLFSSDGINFQNNNVLQLTQGNYVITVKDNNSCSTTQTVFIPLNNTVTVDAGADATICEGKTAQLAAVSNATAFAWVPAATLNNNSIRNPLAAPAATTKYIITATSGICTQRDSLIIFVNPAPKANAGQDQNICFKQNAQLSGSGGISYFWYPPSYLDDARIAAPTAKQLPGSISYFLYVTDVNGCVSLQRDTIVITVSPQAVLNAGNDTSLAIGQPLPLFAKDENNTGFNQYEWSPAYGLDNPFTASPITVLDKDMYYTVTARSAIGCQATDDIKIKVFKGPDIYVPNAFSPNADGINDILRAKPVGIKDFHFFRIYNRWGNIVFTTSDALIGWDGKVKSVDQNPGTAYTWMAEGVDYKGNLVQRKGMVIIVK